MRCHAVVAAAWWLIAACDGRRAVDSYATMRPLAASDQTDRSDVPSAPRGRETMPVAQIAVGPGADSSLDGAALSLRQLTGALRARREANPLLRVSVLVRPKVARHELSRVLVALAAAGVPDPIVALPQ